MRQALSLASPLITLCPPGNPDLWLDTFPPLKIDGAFPKNQTTLSGQKISVSSDASHIAFLFGLKPVFVPIQNGTVVIPENATGQVYAIATSSGTDLSDSNTAAGPAILLVQNGTLPTI